MHTLQLVVSARVIKYWCHDCQITQKFNDSWKTWMDLKAHDQFAEVLSANNFFIFDDLMCKAANQSMFFSVKMLWTSYLLTFVLYAVFDIASF